LGFLQHRVSARSIRVLVWVAGLIALLATIVAWVLPAHPYQAPWAWISFIGMCVVDDFLLGSKERARWGELPKITLFAAIIVFRRHPEITVLVAVMAAPLGSLLKGQSWSTQLTATSQWVLAAVIGAATFRLVGFGDTEHFLAATVGLMVVYYVLGPVLTAGLRAAVGT
jgi:ABC-type Mn2+/Zn2+ transport system permease subunit